MSDQNSTIDWPAIERDFRAGSMSNRQLADWYSISEGAIRKRAKKEGWTKSGTQPKVRTESAHRAPLAPTPTTPETTAPEAIVSRGRNLTLRLLDELEATTSRIGELEMMIDAVADGEDAEEQRKVLKQIISLKQRAEILKSLALSAKTLSETTTAAPAGKKAEKQAAAERVASKFGVRTPPKLVVDNKP
jgi:uncharacterized protein YjcR